MKYLKENRRIDDTSKEDEISQEEPKEEEPQQEAPQEENQQAPQEEQQALQEEQQAPQEEQQAPQEPQQENQESIQETTSESTEESNKQQYGGKTRKGNLRRRRIRCKPGQEGIRFLNQKYNLIVFVLISSTSDLFQITFSRIR